MSTVAKRSLLFVSKLLLLVIGFFCLNFTKAFGIEHHIEWAKAKGLPEPSETIFVTGVILVAAGGYLLGRPRKKD